MMNYTGWTIPEGVVTQVARDGVVLWALNNGIPVIFNLVNVTAKGKTTVSDGDIETWNMVANSGKWLPHSVEVTLQYTSNDVAGERHPLTIYNHIARELRTSISKPIDAVVDSLTITATASDYDTSKIAVLDVEKITSNTYASETTYENEEFILLNIYPKTNGTVTVTYGDLTKTITDTSGAENPNAQQVFFGTFNGVSDDVETPQSGILTIDGDYSGFGCGEYTQSKSSTYRYGAVKEIISLGSTSEIPPYAFYPIRINKSVSLPNSVKTIGEYSFAENDLITSAFFNSIVLPDSVIEIKDHAFDSGFISYVYISKNVSIIGTNVFDNYEGKIKVEVSADNKHFTMEDNILFDKNKTRLLVCLSVSNKNYVIPNTVRTIDRKAFYILSGGLNSITLHDGITSIGEESFFGQDFKELSIPKSISIIPSKAFYQCSNLSTVNVAEGVTEIGADAFGNSGSREYVLPSTLTKIGNAAFGLTTSSGEPRTLKIRILATTPPTYSSTQYNMITGIGETDDISIIVPKGCGETYKTTKGWSLYKDYIVEES